MSSRFGSRHAHPFLLLALLALIAAACASNSTDSSTAAESTTTAPPETTAPAEDDSDGEEPSSTTRAEPAIDDEEVEAEAEVEQADDGPTGKAGAFDDVTQTVADFVGSKGLNGAGLVVVERDKGVVYEQYFGDFDADRISLIASSSKMISAGVLLRLDEQGLLDIDTPIEQTVAWTGNNPDITTAQLLSNSSGLVGLGPDLLYNPYFCQWGVPGTLQDCGETVFSTPNDDADQVAPDSEFRYGGAQWQVAGAVAELVSERPWNELVQDTYEACDVPSLGYISLGAVLDGTPGYPVKFAGDPTSVTYSDNPNIEGGAHITAPDYAKLLLMHLRGGMCGDTQVLTQDSLDTMHADRVAAAYDGAAGVDTGYGMGWWVDRSTGRISDGGAWGTVPWLDLDDGYGAFLVIEDDSSTGQELKGQIEELVATAVTSS